jgi:hypothetical protein
MISERKIAANRMNAKKSCGPRSAAGKRRVCQNALRHGLAVAKYLNSELPPDIELMAKAICGDDTNPLLFEQALVIAESDMVLRYVRAQWVAAIERLQNVTARPLAKGDNSLALAKGRVREMELAWAELVPLKAKFDAMPAGEVTKLLEEWERQESESTCERLPIEERDEFDAMREARPDLDRQARYERRAWSRRKRAIRNFMEIKSMSVAAMTTPSNHLQPMSAAQCQYNLNENLA